MPDDLALSEIAARLGKSPRWLQSRLAADKKTARLHLQFHHYIGKTPLWTEAAYRDLRDTLVIRGAVSLPPRAPMPRRALQRQENGQEIVYFVQAGCGGPIKIGKTRDIEKRLRGLRNGNHEPLTLLAMLPSAPGIERRILDSFRPARLRGEWHQPSERLLAFIQQITNA